MYSLKDLKEKLHSMGVSPKKALGQNFLINESSCEKIVEACKRLNPHSLIEVGPGLGALTDRLLTLDLPILLIELDREFAKYWRDKAVPVWEGDALKLDWSKHGLASPVCLVSNLPYQISSSLVIDRSIDGYGIDSMVLMFQKEVAQRIVSKHSVENYGLLSVISQNAWEVEKLFEISSKDFYPPPQVASQVLFFKRKKELSQKYVNFVKLSFSQRRKMLIKNLSHQFDTNLIGQAFEKLAIDEKVRAENLSPQQFESLFNLLTNG